MINNKILIATNEPLHSPELKVLEENNMLILSKLINQNDDFRNFDNLQKFIIETILMIDSDLFLGINNIYHLIIVGIIILKY